MTMNDENSWFLLSENDVDDNSDDCAVAMIELGEEGWRFREPWLPSISPPPRPFCTHNVQLSTPILLLCLFALKM